ncbi:hypothetical protein JYG23_04495 [Sedimentibacter sp. zth1]|uniref:hypothetical protein n=1 Tax=Sedimentibacter sp. zth1 TaxID=2816908 RepID=UPI001A920DB2|nr:hypothetical protein [Sedimentibacter sp. zth1]QSX06716.1 hypothetical protein JYG23_04495 [Sedimentibacter sp. zth1]
MMEKWNEIFTGTIPAGNYQSFITQNEEDGLIVKLRSAEVVVTLDFGAITALRVLDEGIILGDLFNRDEIKRLKGEKFKNIIYLINDGEYGRFIEKIGSGIYDYLDMKHFVIVTMNYVIEVISEWEPEITLTDCIIR